MARPRSRGGQTRSRGAARGGGYSGRAGPERGGGIGQGPIIAVIAIGGVLAIVLLVILLAQGGGGAPVVPAPAESDKPVTPASPKSAPLTEDEKANFRATIERLAPGERKAKTLMTEGFEAQDRQDYERAQRCWTQARDILRGMIEEAETLAEDLGSERVERELSTWYDSVGKWQRLLSDIIKQLK